VKKKKQGSLSEAAKRLGSVGGKKGGPARARALTATQRTKIARMGGRAKKKAT
jgi:hypothetical protein